MIILSLGLYKNKIKAFRKKISRMKINFNKILLVKFMLFCILFFCCATGKAVPDYKNYQEHGMQNADALLVQKVILKFLQWYKINLHKANSFPILIKDSSDYFMVNKKAVAGYLNFLKSSKCISDKYIAHWQIFFDDKAIQLKKDKIQSDIPEDFDFDFVLITQEPDEILNRISHAKIKTISANNSVALVGVSWPGKDSLKYEFEMYKTKKGWQIGYISTPNFD